MPVQETTHHPVTRKIQVNRMVGPQCDGAISRELATLKGMEKVRPEWQRGEVEITYDLRQIQLVLIEKRLSEIGYPPHHGFIANLKRNWAHFTEQNTLDNLKHIPHCCNKAPHRPKSS